MTARDLRLAPLLLALAAALACASAYDAAYEQETQRLEAEAAEEQRARGEAAQEAYDEASRYAAVVYFEVGSAVIHEAGYKELGWFAQKVSADPSATILVQGFADSTGGDTRNQALSGERAEAVAHHLETLGIARERLVVQGFSSEFAAEANTSAAGRRNNRRVELTVR